MITPHGASRCTCMHQFDRRRKATSRCCPPSAADSSVAAATICSATLSFLKLSELFVSDSAYDLSAPLSASDKCCYCKTYQGVAHCEYTAAGMTRVCSPHPDVGARFPELTPISCIPAHPVHKRYSYGSALVCCGPELSVLAQVWSMHASAM